MMKVLYYYYYIFYTKIIPDDQPHATVIFVLSFLFSLIINGIIDISIVLLFGITLSFWIKIGVFLFILLLMYLTYYRTGKGERIIEYKSTMIINNKRAIFLPILLFAVAILFMFLKADIVRLIINK